jgi:hypothetical protein
MELPQGWTSEDVRFSEGDYLVIRRPDGYASLSVTIDLKKRGFRSGFSTTGPMSSQGSYSGRGWRDRLVAHAVGWLEAI